MSATLSIARSRNAAALKAVIATGDFCRLSLTRRAVTTISPSCALSADAVPSELEGRGGIGSTAAPPPLLWPVDDPVTCAATGDDASARQATETVKRSEERRVGKECVSTCRYRGAP